MLYQIGKPVEEHFAVGLVGDQIRHMFEEHLRSLVERLDVLRSPDVEQDFAVLFHGADVALCVGPIADAIEPFDMP